MEKENYGITIKVKHAGMKITVKEDDNLNFEEFLEIIESIALGLGYHPNTVKKGFKEKAEEYE